MTAPTQAMLDSRLAYLKGLHARAELTLRTAGELDACKKGLVAWTQYLAKKGSHSR